MMDFLLVAFLVLATVYDLKYRRIPNWLIGTGLVLSLSLHFLTGGQSQVIFSFKGFMSGMGLLIIPFAVGGIGAGDVKLLGLVGAIKGTVFVVNSFLWMAVWGGLMAGFILYRNGQLAGTLVGLLPANVKYKFSFTARRIMDEKREKVVYPYALAIALGAFCSYWKGWW